jgi:predicted DNA-binding transcriptional regulator AlpA
MTGSRAKTVRIVEIAELLGVSHQRASKIADKSEFPAPVGREGQSRLWDRREVAAWARKWRKEKPWRLGEELEPVLRASDHERRRDRRVIGRRLGVRYILTSPGRKEVSGGGHSLPVAPGERRPPALLDTGRCQPVHLPTPLAGSSHVRQQASGIERAGYRLRDPVRRVRNRDVRVGDLRELT